MEKIISKFYFYMKVSNINIENKPLYYFIKENAFKSIYNYLVMSDLPNINNQETSQAKKQEIKNTNI